MRIRFILLLLILLAGSGISQTKVGTTAANFLNIPVGARATGMGSAFTAQASDVTAAFWNPAGLSRMGQCQASVIHAGWLAGTHLNWLGAVIQMGESALAVSVNQLDYGEEEITTPRLPDGTGQMWSAQDMAVGVSYARNLTDRFSVGGTVKYIQQRIWHETASAFACDVGMLFHTQLKGLRIGMNIANFGTELQLRGKDLIQPIDIDPGSAGNNASVVGHLETDSWTLPLFFTVGLGMDLANNDQWRITAALDATHANNQTPHLNMGGEICWRRLFFLRAGYNSLFKEEAQEGLTAGFGIHCPVGTYHILIDYSWMDFGIFDSVSRYSVALNF